MNKYFKYYFFTALLILFSIIGTIILSIPTENYSVVDLMTWDTSTSYVDTFSVNEEIYIYTNVSNIDHYSINNSGYLNLNDEDNYLLYIIRLENLTFEENFPVYISLEDTDESKYDEYVLLGVFEFSEGSHLMLIDFYNNDERTPFITTSAPIEVVITDRSEYVIIPILIGFVGVMLFTMVHLSYKRSIDDKKYNQGRHPSKNRKREKY